ncbi:LacI family transcriptional regulator [Pararobbsia alpina]|uniref:LacI family DNA-binding transcriptional regulator n=1 Tax=Pararobbsia alpina TaxID=621374 RepID=UPI0039A743CC
MEKPRIVDGPVTLAHVAERAGVSQMTASRALNGRSGVSAKTRREVVRIATQLGYRVNIAARKLSNGRSRIIAVLAPDLTNQFIGQLLIGAGEAARKVDYEMLVYTLFDESRRSHDEVLRLLQQFADGLIAILPRGATDYVQALYAANMPIVMLDHRGEFAKLPTIASNHYEGATMAMQHLLELGHSRIGFLTGPDEPGAAADRLLAYHHVLAQHGIRIDPQLISQGDFTQRGGFEAARRLLALKRRPTAIFAVNDMAAFGALDAIKDAGLSVPGDMSLIGFDDIPMAGQSHPPLTTVRQPLVWMGRSAVNTLLAQINGIDVASPRVTLPTELVLRGSTASVRVGVTG